MLITCLLFAGYANAQDQKELTFVQKEKSWNSLYSKLEKMIESGKLIEEEKLKDYRQQIRQVRLDASQESIRLKEELSSHNELRATLGEAPEDEKQEDVKVREQRKKLDADISSLDSELKRANLIVAKSDELLVSLDEYQKEKIKAKLFAQIDMPFTIKALNSLLNEFLTSIDKFDSWVDGGLVLIGLLIITLLTKPITRYLNKFSSDAPGIELLYQFSHVRLMLVGISAYFVFLLRFGIINFEQYPALENMVHILASICLSIILFLALGKVQFITPEKDKDFLGERHQGYSWLWNGIKRLVRLILLILPIAAIAGYVNLAQYVSFNILASIAACLLFFILRGAFVWVNCKLYPVKVDEDLSPLTITIIEPILALFSALVALFFWGMTTEDVEAFISKYRSGIQIGDITIDLSAIITSIGLFLALYYFTKLVQWFLSSRVFPYTKLDTGIRDAVTAITGYVGITLALLSAMGSLGLDLSNLAIVVGALSVGIGFGLQAIFNNFVSGIILLLERPMKVGDWIVVGGNQGIIKKISIRSTEIETFWNSSVIIPNSQLISDVVTNWTLYDKVGRVDIAVGVAYGSDTEKVKEVLLKVAKKNPQVRPIPEPKVFFMNFGESSLDFELRCFIRNIRDVFAVSSELRFEVDKAFREHNIQIPFPQRDLHIITPEATKKKPKKKVDKKQGDK